MHSKYCCCLYFQGVDKVSDYPITFHYVNRKDMYSLAWYTYHLKVYGHVSKAFPKIHEYYNSPRTIE